MRVKWGEWGEGFVDMGGEEGKGVGVWSGVWRLGVEKMGGEEKGIVVGGGRGVVEKGWVRVGEW